MRCLRFEMNNITMIRCQNSMKCRRIEKLDVSSTHLKSARVEHPIGLEILFKRSRNSQFNSFQLLIFHSFLFSLIKLLAKM